MFRFVFQEAKVLGEVVSCGEASIIGIYVDYFLYQANLSDMKLLL